MRGGALQTIWSCDPVDPRGPKSGALMDPIIALFKLGQKAHMAELLHEGHVFMNANEFFRRLEAAAAAAGQKLVYGMVETPTKWAHAATSVLVSGRRARTRCGSS